ncbi:MAG TPA: hypothetical protein PKJ23_16240, partial [bacterium]|nr:hypothetical protein [bacterium]
GGMMGMGGLGMGGMMGMGGYGMGGMGMRGEYTPGQPMGMASVVGKTLREGIGIAKPGEIKGIFFGATEKNEFSAESMIDEIRISKTVRYPSSGAANAPTKEDANSTIVDHCDHEYPEPTQLPVFHSQLITRQRTKNDPRNDAIIRISQEREYNYVRKAMGLDAEFLAGKDPTYRTVKKIHSMDYFEKSLARPNLNYQTLTGMFEVPEENTRQVYMTLRFVELAQSLCQQAIDEKVAAVTRLSNRGESYTVTDDEVRNYFYRQIEELINTVLPDGVEGGMGMGMGMMGMGMMGMGGMGAAMQDMLVKRTLIQLKRQIASGGFQQTFGAMGRMGMGGGMRGGMGGMGMMGMGMGIMGLPVPPAWLYDPTTGDRLMGTRLKEVLTQKEKEIDKILAWQKAKADGEIPAEIIETQNETARSNGEDYYIKRAAGLEFESDVKSYARFLNQLEYGNRIGTINELEIESLPDERVKVTAEIEAHYISKIREGEEAEKSEKAPQAPEEPKAPEQVSLGVK